MHSVEKRVLQRDMTANSPPAQSQPVQSQVKARSKPGQSQRSMPVISTACQRSVEHARDASDASLAACK
jgi:hypothetical protein